MTDLDKAVERLREMIEDLQEFVHLTPPRVQTAVDLELVLTALSAKSAELAKANAEIQFLRSQTAIRTPAHGRTMNPIGVVADV